MESFRHPTGIINHKKVGDTLAIVITTSNLDTRMLAVGFWEERTNFERGAPPNRCDPSPTSPRAEGKAKPNVALSNRSDLRKSSGRCLLRRRPMGSQLVKFRPFQLATGHTVVATLE
jgi:hypothetical protein